MKTQRFLRPPMTHPEAGQGAVELWIALPVLLLLLGGALQFGLVFIAKNTVDYAAFRGVRAATLDHGSMQALKTGFAEGLAPLFPSGSGMAGYDQALAKALLRVNNPLDLQIQVLNPTQAVLQNAPSGWVENLIRENGQQVQEIPASRLIFASKQIRAGETLQAANLLKVRVNYCYPLWVPYVSEVIGKLMTGKYATTHAWEMSCYRSGGIPIAAVSTQLMQSSLYPQDVENVTVQAQAPAGNTPPPQATPPAAGTGTGNTGSPLSGSGSGGSTPPPAPTTPTTPTSVCGPPGSGIKG